MRITVSHNKSKDEVIRSIDRSFDDLFRGVGSIPVRLIDEKRHWDGGRLTFSMSATMGFMSTPIAGTIDVTDTDVTIDVNLGLLERLLTPAKTRDTLTTAVRGLLK